MVNTWKDGDWWLILEAYIIWTLLAIVGIIFAILMIMKFGIIGALITSLFWLSMWILFSPDIFVEGFLAGLLTPFINNIITNNGIAFVISWVIVNFVALIIFGICIIFALV